MDPNQERIDALEDMLHQERLLTSRNAAQAVKFHDALDRIAHYSGGDDGALFRAWALKALGISGLEHELTGSVDGSYHCLTCRWHGWPEERAGTRCPRWRVRMT